MQYACLPSSAVHRLTQPPPQALSRPKVRLTLVGRADRTAAELAADAAGRAGVDTKGSPGRDDAKVEPAAADVAKAAEAKPDHVAVRIIAPDVIAVPQRLTP